MANAKKRNITIQKCSVRFAEKLKNLHEQVDYFNNKHKDKVLEIHTIPSVDPSMYPKLVLVPRKK